MRQTSGLAKRKARRDSRIMALEREMETYDRKLPDLLEHRGRYVVIIGDDVIGVYDTGDALEVGYDHRKDPHEGFMVQKIGQEPIVWRYGDALPCR